ncbi:universal stress protein [Microbacterium rhizosphaerae]|uniref:Universal stress protein n=1 Tax=Microbacterium rhizosphaerae TaxID=1678237 RepID=A0ABZ0SIC2_9MICO|nr:universal stress protein [Microbacterium rhizosphaerae]WPR88273.1 universal stress protein [Microbacterium rhizosphaerae]
MVRRYVVAFDDSHPARLAWEWARTRADAEGVQCVAVHVLADDRGTDDRPPGREPSEAVHLTGEVPETLAAFAGPDDVLVIGTGKTGFAHGRVFGFTGVRIVALAPCPVVVIPDVDLRFRSGVVLGVDGAETAAASAAMAATEAARRGEAVQVISSAGRRGGSDSDDDAVKVAERVIHDGWPQLTVRTRARTADTATALLDAAQAATLLVIDPGLAQSDRRSGGPGDIALDVLFNANAPILITRPRAGDRQPSWVE